jgi:hypothetical protein
LLRPIVDEWINGFVQLLESLGVSVQRRHFQFQATFDIDIAYSYRYKGLKRNFGGFLKDFLKGNFLAVSERFNVLFLKAKDPFDSFDFIEQSHIDDECRPIYFFLCAENTTDFDKNILPQNLAMVSLIEKIDKQNIVGLHPSYYSTEKVVLLEQEHLYLNTILGKKTFKSRQHYIKLTLPKTYVNLLNADINEDYSMGYSTHLGFRAGTSRSFFWYNLVEEEQTKLTIHPFCFMDATAHYELKLSAVEAFAQLKLLHDAVQKTNGQLTIVFHNFSLGTATEWSGWSKAYSQFIQMIKK